MKKDILIIAQYLRMDKESGNSRFTYLARMLDEFDVEIVTSNFMHGPKAHRTIENDEENNYKVTFIKEPGYCKNVTLKRFYSHFILSRNIKKYLKTRKKPDLVYCAVPSFDVGATAAAYCKKNKIPFVVDIQDIWPEAFKMAFNPPLISGLIYSPFKLMANYVYKNADEIVAVSETYENLGLTVNKKGAKGLSVFLGTELAAFDLIKNEYKFENKPEGEIWLAYIGTLGTSYNINVITDALVLIKNKGRENIKFIVMGDGPLRNKFEEYAKERNVYCDFTGRLPYNEMVGRLMACDIAVNPLIYSSVASIINKVGDYAAAGLPVVNTLVNKEYRELLNSYNAGFNFDNSEVEGIAQAIIELSDNEALRKEMGANSRKLAEDMFDRKKSYVKIVGAIKHQIINR